MEMDSGSSGVNNIFCAIISAALLVGPIIYAIGVNRAWNVSMRVAAASIIEAVEGGSYEEGINKSSSSEK